MKLILRPVKVVILSVLAYLFDACVMPNLVVGGVTASISFAVIAILTVSYGKKAAFVSGAIIGMLMETMLAGVHALYLLYYPIAAVIFAQPFADMSDRKRESRLTADPNKRHVRRQDDLPAFLRIILCTACLSLLFSIVNILYCRLAGFGYELTNIWRAMLACILSCAAAILLMVPLRAFLGIYKSKRESM